MTTTAPPGTPHPAAEPLASSSGVPVTAARRSGAAQGTTRVDP